MSTKSGRYGDPRRRRSEAEQVQEATSSAHAYTDLRRHLNPGGENIAACRPVKIPAELLAQLPPDVDVSPKQDETLRQCSVCHCDVWVSPVKLSLAKAGKVTIACMECAVRMAGPGAPVVNLNPGRVERSRWA